LENIFTAWIPEVFPVHMEVIVCTGICITDLPLSISASQRIFKYPSMTCIKKFAQVLKNIYTCRVGVIVISNCKLAVINDIFYKVIEMSLSSITSK
jgi:hypothetical protein